MANEASLSLKRAVWPHERVLNIEFADDELGLFDTRSDTEYRLNVTASRIWECLKQGIGLPEISCRLASEFGIDGDVASRSLVDCIEQLLRLKLVEVSDLA
jgi:hypothetical protein